MRIIAGKFHSRDLVAHRIAGHELAAEFITAKDRPDLLQPFVNTVLAQGWSGPGGELEDGKLQARAEPFDLDHIPREVLCLTVGADTQDDRIEASLLWWTKTGECLILGHFVIWEASPTAKLGMNSMTC